MKKKIKIKIKEANVQEEKEKKGGGGGNVPSTKKNGARDRHFCPLSNLIFSLQFSLHFGEKTFGDPKRKHSSPTIYFPSSPPNQTHSKKFSFPFSIQSFPFTIFHLQTNTPIVPTKISHCRLLQTHNIN